MHSSLRDIADLRLIGISNELQQFDLGVLGKLGISLAKGPPESTQYEEIFDIPDSFTRPDNLLWTRNGQIISAGLEIQRTALQ